MKNTKSSKSPAFLCSLVVFYASIFFSTSARAQNGAATFKTNCTPCHGDDGSGDTPTGKSLNAADLRSPEIQKKTDAELVTVIGSGKGNMPSFKASLSDDEIKGVVTYIRTLKKK
jgi:mono/diheme cytochrome c family protein